jgi:hypothetical protein
MSQDDNNKIQFDERVDGPLTYQKAEAIDGDFLWINKEGVVLAYCKMRELSFGNNNENISKDTV